MSLEDPNAMRYRHKSGSLQYSYETLLGVGLKPSEILEEYVPEAPTPAPSHHAYGLKIDDPIWIRNFETHEWAPRHFADIGPQGRITVWPDGLTSHSTQGPALWRRYVKLPNGEVIEQ